MPHLDFGGSVDDSWTIVTPETLPVAMAEVDVDGVVAKVNRAFTDLVAVPAPRLIGHPYWTLLHPDERAAEANSFLRQRRDEPEVSSSGQRRLVCEDGSTRWVELRRTFVTATSATVRSAVVLLLDASARMRAEEEAQSARAQAAEAHRLRDEFVAAVSHELRTPLNAMLGWTNLLKGGQLTPDQQVRAVETIERNARAQARLIGELVDANRILTGRITLDSRPTSLAAIVERVLEETRVTMAEKRLQLDVAPAPADTTVLGDPSRLQQIVWNLWSNAVKFTPAEGRIELRLTTDAGARAGSGSSLPIAPTEAGPQGGVAHTSASPVASVTLTVRDTGIGISPESLPFLFERLGAPDNSSGRRLTGLGLGLALTRHLVHLHGGTVTAHSEGLGHGATFVVVLPLASAGRASVPRS